jgi:hypothetical protein
MRLQVAGAYLQGTIPGKQAPLRHIRYFPNNKATHIPIMTAKSSRKPLNTRTITESIFPSKGSAQQFGQLVRQSSPTGSKRVGERVFVAKAPQFRLLFSRGAGAWFDLGPRKEALRCLENKPSPRLGHCSVSHSAPPLWIPLILDALPPQVIQFCASMRERKAIRLRAREWYANASIQCLCVLTRDNEK